MQDQRRKSLFKPIVLCLVSAGLAGGAVWARSGRPETQSGLNVWLAFGLAALLWFAGTWAGASILDVAWWQPLERKYDRRLPRLIKSLSTLAISVLVLAAILEFIFERPVRTLWAASGFTALGLILGLKDMLRDFFSGVLLNVERPFDIKDHIKIMLAGGGNLEGEVLDLEWRSTRLLTAKGDTVLVPNSLIFEAAVIKTVKSPRPEPCELTVLLDAKAKVDWVRHVLLAGVAGAGVALKAPPPSVSVTAVHSWAVE